MITVEWKAEHKKRVEIKENDVSAVLFFVPGKRKSLDKAVWACLERRMADDILVGRLVVVKEGRKRAERPKEGALEIEGSLVEGVV